jgi:hypothetical protein
MQGQDSFLPFFPSGFLGGFCSSNEFMFGLTLGRMVPVADANWLHFLKPGISSRFVVELVGL